ncbi:MAG: hypothetical protein EBR40_11930, partial [Proteobacteria bacterium]|nr:hypothetical protein [Pseudomonadota bacterium]
MFGAINLKNIGFSALFALSALLAPVLLRVDIAHAQILNPIRWTFEVVQVQPDEALFRATASIDKGWHLYAQEMNFEEGQSGPEPTAFTFMPHPDLKRMGKVVERSKVYEEKAENYVRMHGSLA